MKSKLLISSLALSVNEFTLIMFDWSNFDRFLNIFSLSMEHIHVLFIECYQVLKLF